jgi:hypothetical protein
MAGRVEGAAAVRGRIFVVGSLLVVVAAGVAAALVVLLPGGRPSVAPPPRGIGAAATVDHSALFGDTVHASVVVLVDRRLVNPRSVQLAGTYGDYTLARLPTERRTTTGEVTRLRYDLSLVCFALECLPGEPARHGPRSFQFEPLRIDFRGRGGKAGAIAVPWARVSVGSRMTGAEMRLLTPIDQPPFHVDLALPATTYRISPTLLVALLAALGALLLAGAGVLVLRFAPRPRVAVEPEPEPEPHEALVELTPLERALLLLERARERGGVPDQRKALEHLAGELRRSGAPALAGSATVLAWAERPPAPDETRALVVAVQQSMHAKENGGSTS